MSRRSNPMLYQINTRVSLNRLRGLLGRPATLDDYPDEELDRLAEAGFEWVWFLGVWQTGPAGRAVSLSHPEWLREYAELLGDFTEADVCGSCFAVKSYSVNQDFGGDEALARMRQRLHERGMRLLLDFVPNHTAPDHQWATAHPEFYVAGSEELLAREPQNYTCVATAAGERILAYGRDPYFDGWPDTLQLNYAEPAVQEAMTKELRKIAERCDGVRCDMAMLILPDVFERTWGNRPEPFWSRAIAAVREEHPGFLFMAEVYWDLEWTLQQQGFDYTYDKRLYDRLREGNAGPVRDHFRAETDYQQRSARFLENHDEPRAMAVFDWPRHQAAAVLTYFCQGLRFFHQGQMQGRTKRIPVHLGRGPEEPERPEIEAFYEQLLRALCHPLARNGEWRVLEPAVAWTGNWTSSCFIISTWSGEHGDRLLVAVNFAGNQSQCHVRLPFAELGGRRVTLVDLMGPERYERDGSELTQRGLYLDLRPWGFNVFEVRTDARG